MNRAEFLTHLSVIKQHFIWVIGGKNRRIRGTWRYPVDPDGPLAKLAWISFCPITAVAYSLYGLICPPGEWHAAAEACGLALDDAKVIADTADADEVWGLYSHDLRKDIMALLKPAFEIAR